MIRGLIDHWDKLEYNLSHNVTAADNSWTPQGWQRTLSIKSEWTPDMSTILEGITMRLTTGWDGANFRIAHLSIPDLGVDVSKTEAALGLSRTARLEIDNVSLHVEPGIAPWFLVIGQMRFYLNGVLEWDSENGGLNDPVGLGPAPYVIQFVTSPAPTGIPLLGIPPIVACEDGVIPVPLGPPSWSGHGNLGEDVDLQIAATGTGGYRFMKDGVWQTPPVIVKPIAPPTIGNCGTTNPGDNTPTATNTNNAQVNSHLIRQILVSDLGNRECDKCADGQTATIPSIDRWEATVIHREESANWVMLVANLPKEAIRLNPNYAALILRGGIPFADATASRECWSMVIEDTCSEPVLVGDPNPHYVTRRDYPRYAEHLETVLNVPKRGGIEDPLNQTVYAPFGAGRVREEQRLTRAAEVIQIGACPPVEPDGGPGGGPDACCYEDDQYYHRNITFMQFPNVETSGTNPGMVWVWDHVNALARYINYNAHPFWQYQVMPDNPQWLLEGIRQEDYYPPLRTQWLEHNLLPTAERRKSRNSVISEPYVEGGLSGLCLLLTGFNCQSFWGILRFDVQFPTPPDDVVLDETSEDGWSGDDCTLVIDASGVEVTATVSTCEVFYDLGNFDNHDPRMLPHLCNRIKADWVTTNVDNIAVYLESAAGDRVLLTDNVIGEFDRPHKRDSKYAGSWAQDHGVNIITDIGVDTEPEGTSATTMADPERASFFGLLGGRGAARLVYVVTPTNIATPVKLKFPTFYWSANSFPAVTHENGHTYNCVLPDGPGWRMGNWLWWNPISSVLLDSPAILPIGVKQSVLDYLCSRRIAVDGKERSDGLVAEIEGIYDGFEGDTPEDLASDTIAFVANMPDSDEPVDIPVGMAFLVNSLREVPPLNFWPRRKRNEKMEELGAYGQWIYSLIQEPRKQVNAQAPLHLTPPEGPESLWTVEESFVLGWKRTKHSQPVANDEAPFDVTVADDKLAKARPWHGSFSVADVEQVVGGSVHATNDLTLGMIYVVIAGDTLRFWRFTVRSGVSHLYTISNDPVVSAQVAHRPDGIVAVVYEDGAGGIYYIESATLGSDWSSPMLIATGTDPAFAIDHASNVEFVAYHDGTAWQLKRKLGSGASWVVAGEILTAAAGHAGLEISPGASGTLVFIVDAGGEIRRYVSNDLGITWASLE